jgi:CheY-like chemotaxis protein
MQFNQKNMSENKVKILCVEDEIDIRSNIAEILRDEGYEVFEAGNGYEGYEVFISQRPDLIISDIMMPELDGYGLLKLVRETTAIKNYAVPFIFLSALGQKDNVLKGINLSANDYLVKPIDFDLLIAKIKEKTINFQMVDEVRKDQIQNLKNQISLYLPKEIFAYLDQIIKVSGNLKTEPYGPLPHRLYLEDIKKIYLNSLSLKALINNSLDNDIIDYKLNAEEEIIKVGELIEELIKNIDHNISSRVSISNAENFNLLPSLKVDKLKFLESLWLIIAEILKNDLNAELKISGMLDHLKQLIIVFYLDKNNENKITVDQEKLHKIIEQQNCRFEVLHNKNNTAILTIPEYKLMAN